MSEWTDRVRNHAAFTTLAAVREKLANLDVPEDAPAYRDLMERATVVVEQLDKLVRGAVPQFVPIVAMDDVDAALGNMSTQLDQFNANANPAHLDNVSLHASEALVAAAPLALARELTETADVAEIVGTYREAYESLVEGLRSQVEGLEARLEAALSQIDEKVAAERQGSDEALDALRGTIDRLTTEFTAEKSRLSETLDRQNNMFAETQNTRQTEFQGVLKEIREEFDRTQKERQTNSDAVMERTEKSAGAMLERMEQLRDSSEELARLFGEATQAGGFQKDAEAEGRRALWWAVVAVVALLSLAGFGVYAITEVEPSELNIHESAVRLSVAAALFTLAGLAASQSRRHHQAERRARQFQLEMKALGPYVAELPADDRRIIRDYMTLRIFGQFFKPDEDVTPEGLKNRLQQIREMFPRKQPEEE